MDRAITYHLLATLALLALYPMVECQWIPRHPLTPVNVNLPPLCSSQLALANRACAMLPYTHVPPPSAPSPAPDSPDQQDGRHHHRHHHHGASRDRRETAAEEECCRWVREIDNVCACGALVRLPVFLARPAHNYTVVVNDACAVTFACGPRFLPLKSLP